MCSLAVANLEHDIQLEARMRAALGDANFEQWDRQNTLGSLNLSALKLTDAETDALYTLEKKIRRQMDDLQMARLKHRLTPADYEARQTVAQAEHDQKLKALLGDQRYAVLQGGDAGAGDLKRVLTKSGIEAADIPFEQLLVSQGQYLQHRKEMGFQIDEAKSRIANCEQELQRTEDARTQELQRLLGAEGALDFERGQDARYQEMKQFAATWRLGDGAPDYLFRTVKYYEEVVERYQRDTRALEAQGQAVNWDAVNHNVGLFARQTENTVRAYLGDERFDVVKKNKMLPFASQ